ncbi:DNA binding domain-containing protein, excisionase family [Bacteroides luti]|uniref:DNA binding domain-containing protein, excisionase family n=1 Tax=Bacteroides luti TaxID=1297750 RepID=A0A1M4VIY0_9BACE|nr:helix-turn-helix domain-containing protein [Bacteroides luti]SHE68835.1 DNA binding domain-containing protein, excisionase family [Bacteroides luti]
MGEQVLLIKRDELSFLINEAVEAAFKRNENATPNKEEGALKFLRGNEELAKYLKCSVGTIIRWKNMGLIPFSQKGRMILFDIEKVNEALSNKSFKRK